MTEHTEDIEALAETIRSAKYASVSAGKGGCVTQSDLARRLIAETVLASDWLAEHDADLYDALRDELAYAIRTRDEWESNAGDAEARAEAAEAETARLRHDIEALIAAADAREVRIGAWFVPRNDLRTVLAAERDPEAGEGRG